MFLLMYVFSGILMINHDLFTIPKMVESHEKIPVKIKSVDSMAEYAKLLEDELGLKGRKGFREDRNQNWIFNFNFPGKWVTITLPAARDTLMVKTLTQERTFYSTLRQMHTLRRYKGGWPYTLWATFYDITSIALSIFALTGILLWFNSKRLYPYSWIFLVTGLLIPLVFAMLYLYWR